MGNALPLPTHELLDYAGSGEKTALFLANIRGEERFKKLMERVKYEWEHFEV
jgi:hypothetical protein